jgi:hypothetical protein
VRFSSLLLSIAVVSCADGKANEVSDSGPDAGAVPLGCLSCTDASQAATIRATLVSSCATGVEVSCHSTGAGGLTLGTVDDFAQIVDVPSTQRPELYRVAPGNPPGSYLFLKLLNDGGIEGGPMPGGTYDPRLVALFGAWIEAGAPVR